jgi:hypothetical protein
MKRVLNGNATPAQGQPDPQAPWQAAPAPQPLPQPHPMTVPTTNPLEAVESILDKEISQQLKWVRAIGGFLGLLFGALLFRVTMTEAPSPLEAFLMIAYLMVAIFWILTFRTHMPLRRFLLELVLFVAATMALKAGNPMVFEQDSGSGKRPTFAQPAVAAATDEEFVQALTVVLTEGQAVLESAQPDTQPFLAAFGDLEKVWSRLEPQVASEREDLHRRAQELNESVQSFADSLNLATKRKTTFLLEDLRNSLGL